MTMAECVHHWLLASPNLEIGQTVVGGICRKCGRGADFPVSMPDKMGWDRSWKPRQFKRNKPERVW